MTETTSPVSATELLAYLLTQYERAVSIHAQVRMDTDEDRRLHADAVTALRRAAEPVARYLDSAARRPLAVADIPAGQGPASLLIVQRGGHRMLQYKSIEGTIVHLETEPDHRLRYGYSADASEALWGHLAATLPHVTTEETP